MNGVFEAAQTEELAPIELGCNQTAILPIAISSQEIKRNGRNMQKPRLSGSRPDYGRFYLEMYGIW